MAFNESTLSIVVQIRSDGAHQRRCISQSELHPDIRPEIAAIPLKQFRECDGVAAWVDFNIWSQSLQL